MILKCPRCQKPVINEDRRRVLNRLKPQNGSTLTISPNQAPRVKCGGCGLVTILLKGALS